MMILDFMLKVFEENREKPAVIWKDRVFNYSWMLDKYREWQGVLESKGIKPGMVTILEADFSPSSIALFLALVDRRCILVPLTSTVADKKNEFIEIARGEVIFSINKHDESTVTFLDNKADHEFFNVLRSRNSPGLVLFSSGSTGKSKAAVHDLLGILDKFQSQRHCFRSITFLLFDHIGGVNTMFYELSNAGCIVTVPSRDPDTVLSAVEKYQVELLPTSPTFINLILLSEAYKRHDLTSLKIISYGTEPMPESTLKRLHEILPEVRLLQTYGLSEVGILRSKSKSSDSLWVKVGGEGYETRVVDGILHIKAKAAMLGYLNAPSPFTADGWFNTDDRVEVDGEYFRILGRDSEIINVGGNKVYPTEVESVIQAIENIAEVTVFGEKNLITGNIVCARVRLKGDEDPKEATLRIKQYCHQRLESFKVPVKITFVTEKQHSDRFKKMRANF